MMIPNHPNKYISDLRQDKVAGVRNILLGRQPVDDLQRRSCRVLEHIYDLKIRADKVPVRGTDAFVLLRSIGKSLDAMSANIITTMGMKSSQDLTRTLAEMEARCRYYESVIPDEVCA